MRSTKRIILADGSRLVREMLHHALDKAEQLQIVDEVPDHEGLPLSIEKSAPAWVIVPLPYSNSTRDWIDACITNHPAVGFVFLSPHQNQITMKWQTSCEEEYSDLSLKEFIQILEKDLQHT
jgi:DNA-binding NarL/FixJ family response regulator